MSLHARLHREISNGLLTKNLLRSLGSQKPIHNQIKQKQKITSGPLALLKFMAIFENSKPTRIRVLL